MLPTALRRVLARPHRRLRRAEARFFDAYCQGGWRDPRDLVVPLDYFARARVDRILDAWLVEGRALDLDALLAEWRDALPPYAAPDERLFFKNLAHFLALVERPRAEVVAGASPSGFI